MDDRIQERKVLQRGKGDFILACEGAADLLDESLQLGRGFGEFVGYAREDRCGGFAAGDDEEGKCGFDFLEAHLFEVRVVFKDGGHEVVALLFEVHAAVDFVEGDLVVGFLHFLDAGWYKFQEEKFEPRVVTCGGRQCHT